MKTLNIMLLGVLLAGTVAAQASSTGADVEVLSSRCRHLAPVSLALAQDPLAVNERQRNLQKGIAEAIVENRARVKANQPQVQIPTVGVAAIGSGPTPLGSPSSFRYEIRVRNKGTKTIRRLVWGYALSDQDQKTVSRSYQSKTKIRPNATRNLFALGGPPRGVINASQGAIEDSPEQVVIERVEYSDGSVWIRPPAHF